MKSVAFDSHRQNEAESRLIKRKTEEFLNSGGEIRSFNTYGVSVGVGVSESSCQAKNRQSKRRIDRMNKSYIRFLRNEPDQLINVQIMMRIFGIGRATLQAWKHIGNGSVVRPVTARGPSQWHLSSVLAHIDFLHRSVGAK